MPSSAYTLCVQGLLRLASTLPGHTSQRCALLGESTACPLLIVLHRLHDVELDAHVQHDHLVGTERAGLPPRLHLRELITCEPALGAKDEDSVLWEVGGHPQR